MNRSTLEADLGGTVAVAPREGLGGRLLLDGGA